MRSEKHLKVHSEEMNWSVPAWLWPISRKRDLWVERMPKNQQIAMSYSTISHTVQTNGWGKKIFNKKNFKIYLLKEKYSALKMLSNYWIIWGNTLKFNENHDIMPHCGYNFVKIVYLQRKKSEMKHTQMLITASQCGEKASDIYLLLCFLFSKFPTICTAFLTGKINVFWVILSLGYSPLCVLFLVFL